MALALLLFFVAAGCIPVKPRERRGSPSPAAASALPAAPVEVPLLPYFRQLRTVQLTSGSDTLTFLLDTGGGHSLLTLEAARKLGCTPFGRTVAHRMSGERVEFQWCADVPLALGGISLEQPVVAVFDLMALLPSVLPPLDGLLSLKSFEHRVVSIDLPGERLILETEASAAARQSRMQRLTARTATGADGSSLTVFLGVRAQGAAVWFLLDSGNLVGTIVSPHAVEQLGLAPPAALPAGEGSILESVPLQVLGLPPRTERIFVRDLIYDGALGAAFMEQGIFMFDLRGNQPWIGLQPGA